MSVSGPSPLRTLLVQRVEAALGTTLAQQTTIAASTRPDVVAQPGQAQKPDPAANPPTERSQGQRPESTRDQNERPPGLTALNRNDPEVARLLASRSAPMTAYTTSAPTTLGPAAKAILMLFQQYPEGRPIISGRAPLLPAPPLPASPIPGAAPPAPTPSTAHTPAANATATPNPGTPSALATHLTAALREALQHSGLFYESHLRDLTFGHRSLNELRLQPQARHASTSPQPSGAQQAGSTHAGATSGGGAQPNAPHGGTQPASTPHMEVAPPGTHSTAQQQSGALAALDPATHQLVRHQLEVLATQTLIWQGEAWPGAELEWEIGRQDNKSSSENETDAWSTRLRLSLPGLGEVEARLSLVGSQLVMQVVAPQGAALMTGHADQLRARLNLQGLTLQGLSITADTDDGSPT